MIFDDAKDARSGGQAKLIATTAVPAWAEKYSIQVQSDGRVFLHGEADGCELWIQPKAWAQMRVEFPVKSEVQSKESVGATLNYGLDMSELASHSGKLETNDGAFGGQFLTGHEKVAPLPSSPAYDVGPYGNPCLILVVGLFVVAAIHRFKKRPN